MASIEFIQKRIDGKEKEIEKLEKKLERIHQAQATNWEKNPYYYSDYDLRVTTKDLESAQKALDDYKAQLERETQKANSRNVPVIVEFLDRWKARMLKFYKTMFEQYINAREERFARNSEYVDWLNREGYKARIENRQEYDRICKQEEKDRKNFQAEWNFMTPFVGRQYNTSTGIYSPVLLEDKVQKMLDQDANAKYDFIIERTNAIVGQITDASGLYIGDKGDLNGVIIGTEGKAKVQTIGAGGWNIQVAHFRTLIHPVK